MFPDCVKITNVHIIRSLFRCTAEDPLDTRIGLYVCIPLMGSSRHGKGAACVCVCVINNSWDPPDTGMGLYVYIQLMGSSGRRDGALCIYTTHGILRTQGWGCICVHNSWDPPDTGMGLLYIVCVCVCV